ncbi:uncharacterized protein [Argopecten irradians]|uniref:uncharacterized protein n=1 Tax=Argopecten irradians TaxID=31199 RepID=UPI00371E8EBB
MQSKNVNDHEKERSNYFKTLMKASNDQPLSSTENLVLNLILPILPVAESVKEAREIMKEEQVFSFYGRKTFCDVQLIAGSSSDGLSLPEITHITRSSWYKEMPDEDVVYLYPFLKVDPHQRRAFARPIPIREYPGYVHMAFNTDWLNQRQTYYDQFYMFNSRKSSFANPAEYVDSDGFVLRAQLARKLKQEADIEGHNEYHERSFIRIHGSRNVSVEYSHHGPALTAELCERTYNIHYSKDYVLALPHPSWPVEASPWRHRARNWPPVSVLNAVVKCGCLVVAKSHKKSKDPREFILSFGVASRTVAHAFNMAQFRSYKLLKYIFRFHINKVKRGMSTFHCKQIMFWTCERSPQDDWKEDNPFECLQRLFHQMEVFLSSHYLPHYFIAEYNTIGHISAASVAAIRRDVVKVRDTCLAIVLDLIEAKRFCWLSRDISLTSCLSPALSGDGMTKRAMALVVLDYVSILLDKGEISMALYLLGADMLHEMGIDNYNDMTLNRLEEALKHRPEESTLCCLNGLLASLYHQRAMLAKGNQTIIEKSRAIFNTALANADTHIWVYGEYYNLLSTTNQHQLLLEHFATHLLPRAPSRGGMLYQGGIYTSISVHNRLTMDMCVQDAIVDCKIPSTAFLFFKIIQTLVVLHTNHTSECSPYHDAATKALKQFDAWTKLKTSRFPETCDEHIHVLLAYSYDCVGRPDGAEEYFDKAASFGVDYKDEDESDDLVISTPVIIRLRRIAEQQRARNSKPYNKPSRGKKSDGGSKYIPLKFGEVRVNPYVHC